MRTTNMAHWKGKKRIMESRRRPILTEDDFIATIMGVFGPKPKQNNHTKKPAIHRERS